MIYEPGDSTAIAQRIPRQFQQLRRLAFGPTVHHHRREQSISRGRLAALLGVDEAYVRMIEDGQVMPCLDTIYDIADALEVGAGDLLREAEAEAEDRLYQRLHAHRRGRAS